MISLNSSLIISIFPLLSMYLHLPRIISGAPFVKTILSLSFRICVVVIILRLLSRGISSILSSSISTSLQYFKMAPSVWFPITSSLAMIALLQSFPIFRVFSSFVKYESTTVILFSVSVPVLSLQIMVHDPKVSTDSSFLTIASDFAICDIPRANVNVRTAGNPSGMAATASETAVMNVSTSGTPLKSSKMNTAIQTMIAMIDSVFPRFPTLVLRGVSSSSS